MSTPAAVISSSLHSTSASISFPSAPSSRLEPSYWEALYKLKLDKFKLDNSQKDVLGSIPLTTSSISSSASFDCVSFSEESFREYLKTSSSSSSTQSARIDAKDCFHVRGTILNCNTIEEFKAIDKKDYIENIASNAWSKISSTSHSTSTFDMLDLLKFSLITFADLKTYKFTYWFAFPSFIPSVSYRLLPLPLNTCRSNDVEGSGLPTNDVSSSSESTTVIALKDAESITSSGLSGSEFIRRLFEEMYRLWVRCHSGGSAGSEGGILTPFHRSLAVIIILSEDGSLQCLPLDDENFAVIVDFERKSNNGEKCGILKYWIGIQDGGHSKGSHILSWHNRNILAFIYCLFAKHGISSSAEYVDLICIRGRLWTYSWSAFVSNINNDNSGVAEVATHTFDINQDRSCLMRWSISEKYFDISSHQYASESASSSLPATGSPSLPLPKVFGWELNDKGKPGPSLANLASTLDPAVLMTQAIDLNIRLMRWRLWTSLENEKIGKLKCLLFGAGTLGCAVARCLLGWGIKHITLVDNGLVSYSNPARQMLFEFDDALKRKPKATTAAQRLRSIYPQVHAKGIVCSIPMPGHSFNATAPYVGSTTNENPAPADYNSGDAFKDTVDTLDSLVQEHDVVFNMTDSREARWLPTLLSTLHNKLMISIALGFDSYLVMRHGLRLESTTANCGHRHERVGCYFCSDIVAAANSTHDRSMDQQCTVTRPGSSFISSGVGVELMVSYLHSLGYPDLSNSSSLPSVSSQSEDCDEAEVPHQIRGSLKGFNTFLPRTPAFPQCTACSDPVVAAYAADKYGFIKSVCERPELLQDVSGISELTAGISDGCDWDGDSEDEEQ